MKPAERVALLTALIAGATAELDRAKTEALTVADAVGVKSFTTAFGNVTVGQKEAKPQVTDNRALMAWVKEHRKTEIEVVTRIRPAYVTALLDSVVWVKDDAVFVDPATGLIVPGVTWSAAGEPYITWPSSTDQKRTKEEAATWFSDRAEALLGGMSSIEASK